MKQTITTRLTIPKDVFNTEDGYMYLHLQIKSIADDLADEHGYTTVEYVDHKLEEGSLDSTDSDYLSFVLSYEVG